MILQACLIQSIFREISEVYSSVLPVVRILNECRCPDDYPRIKPGKETICVRNGFPLDNGDEVSRIDSNAHTLEFLNDGDSNSFWVSVPTQNVYIEIQLGDQFQVVFSAFVKFCS